MLFGSMEPEHRLPRDQALTRVPGAVGRNTLSPADAVSEVNCPLDWSEAGIKNGRRPTGGCFPHTSHSTPRGARMSDPQSVRANPASFVRRAVEQLTPRQQLILQLKYGLGGEEAHTDEQISDSLGISPAAVRADEKKALRALREFSPDDLAGIAPERDPDSKVRVSEIIEQVKELTPELVRHLHEHSEDLQRIDPAVAEHLVAELLAQRGFKDVPPRWHRPQHIS